MPVSCALLGLMEGQQTMLVISAHFDDAVLSVGGLLQGHPGATVLTIFGGCPKAGIPAHPWDRPTGAAMARDAVEARSREDLAALGQLGASQRRLRFLDLPYRHDAGIHEDEDRTGPLMDELVADVTQVVEALQPVSILVPLGAADWHPNHHEASEAALAVSLSWARAETIIYTDLPYALAIPDAGRRRLDELASRRLILTPHPSTGPETSMGKAQAMACYLSQAAVLQSAFGDSLDRSMASASERFYRVARG
jgi:LmbE family N-acetylglucosaminyl deacetylase